MDGDRQLTSTANPRVKFVVGLRSRRSRDAQGVTCLDGIAETRLALDAGWTVRALFYCADLMGADAAAGAELVARARSAGAETIAVSRTVFERMAYREGPDGILAVVPSPGAALASLDVPAGALVVVAQRIEKPGNLGAMLRTADAAGVAAVIAADPVTDWGNPNVIRASKGTVFSVPVAAADTGSTLAWLAERGLTLVATTPDTSVRHFDADLTGGIAVAVGAEKWGLDERMLAAAGLRVRIPMAGRADSLNAATSAAIVLYEAVRQRSLSG